MGIRFNFCQYDLNFSCIVFFFSFHPTHPTWENDVDKTRWDGLKPPTACVGLIYWFLDL